MTMKADKQWTTILKQQMSALQITQEDLAQLLAMTRGNVGHYLSGRSEPPLGKFIEICSILRLLDKPLTEILKTESTVLSSSNFLHIIASKCPILSWEEATEWPNNVEEFTKKPMELLSHKFVLGPTSYALKVTNNSMADHFVTPSFHEGTYIVVDPGKKYKSGDFVVFKEKGVSELVFRRYVKEGKKETLYPINKEYYDKTEVTSKITICGVVIANLTVLA